MFWSIFLECLLLIVAFVSLGWVISKIVGSEIIDDED